MPANCVTVPSSYGFYRPLYFAGPRNSELSPTSSLSSTDGRSSVDANMTYYKQTLWQGNSSRLTGQLDESVSQPSLGVTPSSSLAPSSELSPYKPPHPTPQDTRDATVSEMETYPPRNRRRRLRTIYTAHQIRGLEQCFNQNKYPDIGTREALAMAIGMSEARVQVWFQNRRARLRRQEKSLKRKEMDQQEENNGQNKRVCQSDDVSGSDEASHIPFTAESTEAVETSPRDDEDQEEIDVVSISKESDSPVNMPTSRSPSSDPTITSNYSTSPLIKVPAIVPTSPPQVCTKPCCCPPVVIPPYTYFPQHMASSLALSYHRGLLANRATVPLPELSTTAPWIYNFQSRYTTAPFPFSIAGSGFTSVPLN
ncbi:Homeobox protein aristaless [Holothuria leucospilota]|uniref:Homeobox protein aristaless n=1 Tax=Holothuria leucospilota TaxID=206669 RepID=A0A9Q1CKM5_HOLLE|nr:Homeobox protein aristaless [Holothuria leucospilota]